MCDPVITPQGIDMLAGSCENVRIPRVSVLLYCLFHLFVHLFIHLSVHLPDIL